MYRTDEDDVLARAEQAALEELRDHMHRAQAHRLYASRERDNDERKVWSEYEMQSYAAEVSRKTVESLVRVVRILRGE